MPLAPTIAETLNRARADLRAGLPVVLTDADGAALAVAAETVGPGRFAALLALPGGLELALTARRAQTLRLAPYDGDMVRIAVPTGRGLAWVRAMADPAEDLTAPLKGPFHARRDGAPALHRAALGLLKYARLLPAALMLAVPDGAAAAARDGLTLIDMVTAGPRLAAGAPLHHVIDARLPTRFGTTGRLHVFRPDDGGDEHTALEIGAPPRDAAVLVRLHSACFTGDLLGSLKCDCGPQLHAALDRMAAAGAGLLLYLNQEGRGVGLTNKLRAYSLQDQGFDTVEANHRLGFEDDERDFRTGARIIAALGFSAIRLMTNNPAKVAMMSAQGIAVVERVPLQVGQTAQNRAYLATKAAKSGHIL